MKDERHVSGMVYILGAGASNAICGFPLLGNFLQDCREAIAVRKELTRYLEERFGCNDGNWLDTNLEDVLADLDNTLYGLGEVWYGAASHPLRLQAQVIRSQLLEVIQARLAPRSGNGEPIDNVHTQYEQVLGKLTGADAVITFNYDRSLDYCSGLRPHDYVLNPSINYLTPEELVSGKNPWLLPLHGSIDFLACSNSKCPQSWRILGPRESSNAGQRMCGICGADMEIVIIPPSMTKSFQRYPLLSALARIARERLMAAGRIVIWGFSCPATDHHVAWLLRSCRAGAGNLRRIDVIDPKAGDVLKRFKALLAPGKSTECHSYDNHNEYIKEHPIEN